MKAMTLVTLMGLIGIAGIAMFDAAILDIYGTPSTPRDVDIQKIFIWSAYTALFFFFSSASLRGFVRATTRRGSRA